MSSLRDRILTRRGAEAITAPTAILAAGAGAAAGIVVGLPLVGAAVVGAGAWAATVARRLPVRDRRQGTSRVDPMSIGEPWRRYVMEAIRARARFDDAVEITAPGPLQDRLSQIGRQVEAAVGECWRIARRGDALDSARAQLDVGPVRRQIEELERNVEETWFAGSDAEATLEALRAQVASADRVRAVAEEARDKLQLLDARLDEAVARAIELSVRADEPADLGGLGADVDALVDELEALRSAMEESAG